MKSVAVIALLAIGTTVSAWMPCKMLAPSTRRGLLLVQHPLRQHRAAPRATAVDEHAPAATEKAEAASKLKRERYVATNRFVVREGKDAKFEKRWATRKVLVGRVLPPSPLLPPTRTHKKYFAYRFYS